ncbi:hypothetical protein [Succinivibrio dextrinosolvens]|uniref:hypothetical protein n=1 Tax=Succinivibrio dextrinosolvens TaxID=83771 RepID=UPI00241C585F|nr:hypothetical protein [Succinivibrio dextrinosolvens]MBE6422838.1 hypothetical protein [Succinivibrio dextrinosolvens]
MVIYELIKETKEKLDYSYYPEGNKDKKAGLITIDRINEKIDLTEVAEGDYEIVELAEDLLRMDQSFIDLAEEEGDLERARLLREELEENKKKGKYKGFQYYCYACHVIHNLVKKYNSGIIPQSDTVYWY